MKKKRSICLFYIMFNNILMSKKNQIYRIHFNSSKEHSLSWFCNCGQISKIIRLHFHFFRTFCKGNIFMTSFLFPWTIEPFRNGINSLRKEFAPTGAKFFPLKVGRNEMGGKNDIKRVASPESVPIYLKT